MKTTIRLPKETGGVDITFKSGAEVSAPPTAGVFYVLATADLTIMAQKTKMPAVSIRAIYELRYHVPEKLHVSASDLHEFAQTNGIFNAWPFFREFVQSSFERMHLPALTLPVYRLGQAPFGSSENPAAPPKRRDGLKK